MLINMGSHFVVFIKLNFEISVVCRIARIIELIALKPVSNTVMNGINIHSQEQHQVWLESIRCWDIQMTFFPGIQKFQETYNPMIKKLLKWKRKTMLVLVAFTVLKQFVHLVVLWLHGPSLQNLSHQQRFWSSWQTHIQMKPQDQITYALIRHIRFLEQAFKVEAGIYGAIPVALLLMLIIISITVLQIGCVEHIAILLLWMDQHLI